MRVQSILLFLSFIILSAPALSQAKESGTYNPLEGFNGETLSVFETIVVGEGETFDGGGNLYDWDGEGDCSQTEGMPPMFVLLPNARLQNIWIKDAPDGVHIKGSNVVIDNMVNIDVCEDAISISKSRHYEVGENINILNSKFFYCEDKAIQLTRGENILIKSNEFYECAKAVRIKEEASNIKFEGNKVYDAKSAIKVTGGQGYARGNLISGSREAFWVEENGSFTDEGNNLFMDIEELYKESTGGKIIRP